MGFPISAKLIPYKRNLAYLAFTAVITRMVVGLVRVWQNAPSKNTDPSLTPNQKRQAFLERIFVELFGTAAYIGALHLGQDLVSKFFEKGPHKLNIPTLSADQMCTPGALDAGEIAQANKALKDVFGKHDPATGAVKPTPDGLIYRSLFSHSGRKKVNGQTIETQFPKANLAAVREKIGDPLFKKVQENFISKLKSGEAMPLLDDFAMRLNRAGMTTIAGGVLMSALFGGFVTQRFNDDLVAPKARRWLNKTFSAGSAPTSPENAPDGQSKKPGKPASPDPTSGAKPSVSGKPSVNGQSNSSNTDASNGLNKSPPQLSLLSPAPPVGLTTGSPSSFQPTASQTSGSPAPQAGFSVYEQNAKPDAAAHSQTASLPGMMPTTPFPQAFAYPGRALFFAGKGGL